MRPDIVLAIDTSAAHCAAALLFGHREPGLKATRKIISRCEGMAKGQAERLPVLVADLLHDAKVGWPDITLLAVGVGPGNFTGIRIAVAYVRGLALGLGIPAKGVTLFEAVVMASGGSRFPYWTVIDAPRGAVYAQRFPQGAACILDAEESVPDDAPKLRLSDLSGEQVIKAIAEHAHRSPTNPDSRPAPFYLRGPDAAPPRDPPPVILP